MMKIFFLLIPAFIISCTGNLVKNPGGETVPLTNEWTIASGKWIQRKKAPLPQEGSAYFFPSVAAHAELFQDIDVSKYRLLTDMGLMNFHYKAYMRAYPQRPADQSYEVVETRDANSSVLDSFATAHYDSTNVWVSINHKQALPKGTRIIRIRLLSERYNGSNNDGYHDNIFLSVVISPWVYVLLFIIVFFGGWLWLRKKRKHSLAGN